MAGFLCACSSRQAICCRYVGRSHDKETSLCEVDFSVADLFCVAGIVERKEVWLLETLLCPPYSP